jgi:hypothetical protein
MPKKGIENIKSIGQLIRFESVEERRAFTQWAYNKGYASAGAVIKVAMHQFYKRNKPKDVPAVLRAWVE